MLTRLRIEGFQSLRKADLELGRFTVITGATGSGKSAVVRALQLLAFNARGTGYVRHGEAVAQVTAADEAGWSAGIQRGRVNRYAVQLLIGGDVMRFDKIGTDVPGQVTGLLALGKLNFAGQFDKPFLLDESAGEVARVLGELTNVTLLLNAAREAARRRQGIQASLRGAEASLASLAVQARRFAGLKERRAALSAAEEALQRAAGADARLARLSTLAARCAAAQAAVRLPPQVPDVSALEAGAARLAFAREAAQRLDRARAAILAAVTVQEEAGEAQRAADAEYRAVLERAGVCPVCGQPVHPADASH